MAYHRGAKDFLNHRPFNPSEYKLSIPQEHYRKGYFNAQAGKIKEISSGFDNNTVYVSINHMNEEEDIKRRDKIAAQIQREQNKKHHLGIGSAGGGGAAFAAAGGAPPPPLGIPLRGPPPRIAAGLPGGGDGAAGGGGICCWLCGFPIGDMTSGIFPGTTKRTADYTRRVGQTGKSKTTSGYWGMGVGEHILIPPWGYTYCGLWQPHYGRLADGSPEKEFLKKEVRWAHRYCNVIKGYIKFASRIPGDLLRINNEVIDEFVENLWKGLINSAGNRSFLKPYHEVQGSTSNWRSLLHYWIDKTKDSQSFIAALEAWKVNRKEQIKLMVNDLVNAVNNHNRNQDNNPDGSVLEINFINRFQNPHKDNRPYQQLNYGGIGFNPAINATCYSSIKNDLEIPSVVSTEREAHPLEENHEIFFFSPSQLEEEGFTSDEVVSIKQAQEDLELQNEEVRGGGDGGVGGGGGGGGGVARGKSLNEPSAYNSNATGVVSRILQRSRTKHVPASNRRYNWKGRRETYERNVDENLQAYALWGNYGGCRDSDIHLWNQHIDNPRTPLFPGGGGGGAGGGAMKENHRKRKTRRRKNRRRSTRKRAQ